MKIYDFFGLITSIFNVQNSIHNRYVFDDADTLALWAESNNLENPVSESVFAGKILSLIKQFILMINLSNLLL